MAIPMAIPMATLAASNQDLPKALVQGMPLYKGRENSRVPIQKINVPILRVSCPYTKNQCPYLFGQFCVILCFNFGTKICIHDSWILFDFNYSNLRIMLIHGTRRLPHDEAQGS